MKVTVKKDKLIKIIKRHFTYYTEEQIKNIIETDGAQYFNCAGSDLNIEYLGFGEWKINI